MENTDVNPFTVLEISKKATPAPKQIRFAKQKLLRRLEDAAKRGDTCEIDPTTVTRCADALLIDGGIPLFRTRTTHEQNREAWDVYTTLVNQQNLINQNREEKRQQKMTTLLATATTEQPHMQTGKAAPPNMNPKVSFNFNETNLVNNVVMRTQKIARLNHQIKEWSAQLGKNQEVFSLEEAVEKDSEGVTHCKVCRKKFSSVSNTVRHYKEVHTVGFASNRKEKCPYYLYTGRKEYLEKHVQHQHSGKRKAKLQLGEYYLKLNKLYKCMLCGTKSYKAKYDCEKHIKNIHFGQRELLKCDYCKFEGSKYLLKKHMQEEHTG